jgi:tetratricopeptide (TPR) repeat protein
VRAFNGAGALALALLLLMQAAAARAAAIAGPALDAAAYLALRGEAAGPALRLVFDARRGNALGEPMVVVLGTDYVDIAAGARETIYDFRLRRRLELDRKAGVFSNLSLYADVAFRRFELEKRVLLSRMFAETAHAEPPAGLRSFWIESAVGIDAGAKDRPPLKSETLADGARRFRAGDQQATLFAPAREAVPETLRRSFARFLALHVPLHPEILKAIMLDGRLPQRLVWVEASGETMQTAGLLLRRSGHFESAPFPLPSALAPAPLAGNGKDEEVLSLAVLLPSMRKAVAGQGPAPQSLRDYRRAADTALRRGQRFEAALILAEMSLEFGAEAHDCSIGPGGVPCHGADELTLRLRDDARVKQLYAAQGEDATRPEAAAELWQKLKHDDVPHGFVVDAFLADRLSAAGRRREAIGAFARAIAGNPRLSGLYKLIGDHFLRASRTDLGWICYDLGRALPDRERDDPLSTVDELESALAEHYPQFF